jgi:electron transfer flavoprotein beta subunit
LGKFSVAKYNLTGWAVQSYFWIFLRQFSTEIFMHIIVLVKQVPNTSEVRIDPKTGNLVREGVESIINPEDRHALEAALDMVDKAQGTVTVLSMGPPQAIEVVCEALAMGVDRGILLTDRAFAGADTWATSTTLGLAIKRIGDFDLILAGRQAVDGDTAQIGPQVAEFLGIPQLTYVTQLNIVGNRIIAERIIENGCEHIESPLPALATCMGSLNTPRHPTVAGILQATSARAPVEVWNASDIGAKAHDVGLPGSLTQVVRTFTPKEARNTQYLDGPPAAVASQLIEAFRERDIRLGE